MSAQLRGDSWRPNCEQVDVAFDGDVAILRINTPAKLNALTGEMLTALAAGLRELGDGAHAAGVVVTGAGRAFSAGHDLAGVDLHAPFSEADVQAFHDLTRAALGARVPIVAAVNGIAVGGAAEWTLSFDARVGCETTEFLLPENRIGLTVTNGASLLLPRLLGGGALGLVLDGRRIAAREALALGLLDVVVARDQDVVAAATALVRRWAQRPSSTAMHLRLLRPSPEEVESAMARETAAARAAWDAQISRVGIEAFLQARS